MKTMLTSGLALAAAALTTGCTEKSTAAQTAQDQAEAKARAEALKKEMETAPKVFSNRDIFKKNEPAPAASTPPAKTDKK